MQTAVSLLFTAIGGLLIVFVAIPTVADISQNNLDQAVTESLACTTGAGATTCNVTLADKHIHADTSGITITETSPGSGTLTGSLASLDRVTLTVQGLTASTPYIFSVAYLRQDPNVSGPVGGMFRITPALLMLVIVVAIPIGGAMAFLALRKRFG